MEFLKNNMLVIYLVLGVGVANLALLSFLAMKVRMIAARSDVNRLRRLIELLQIDVSESLSRLGHNQASARGIGQSSGSANNSDGETHGPHLTEDVKRESWDPRFEESMASGSLSHDPNLASPKLAPIPARFVDEIGGRLRVESNPSADYFLVLPRDGDTELTVQENILRKKPSPAHDSMLSRFFSIEVNSVGSALGYRLIDPAVIEWNATTGQGWLKLMGKIEQI